MLHDLHVCLSLSCFRHVIVTAGSCGKSDKTLGFFLFFRYNRSVLILRIKEEPWKKVIQSLHISRGKDSMHESTRTSFFLFYWVSLVSSKLYCIKRCSFIEKIWIIPSLWEPLEPHRERHSPMEGRVGFETVALPLGSLPETYTS